MEHGNMRSCIAPSYLPDLITSTYCTWRWGRTVLQAVLKVNPHSLASCLPCSSDPRSRILQVLFSFVSEWYLHISKVALLGTVPRYPFWPFPENVFFAFQLGLFRQPFLLFLFLFTSQHCVLSQYFASLAVKSSYL